MTAVPMTRAGLTCRITSIDARTAGGFEPIFAGLVLRAPDGRMVQCLLPTQELETRDESIAVYRQGCMLAEIFATTRMETVVLADIRRESFDPVARNVPLAAGPAGPTPE